MTNLQIFYGLIILCVITHIIRTIYEILKHRKTITASRLSFIAVFINMFVLWSSWFSLGLFDPFRTRFPEPFFYLGISLVGSGIILFITALLTIKSFETYKGDLISHGIYSVLR